VFVSSSLSGCGGSESPNNSGDDASGDANEGADGSKDGAGDTGHVTPAPDASEASTPGEGGQEGTDGGSDASPEASAETDASEAGTMADAAGDSQPADTGSGEKDSATEAGPSDGATGSSDGTADSTLGANDSGGPDSTVADSGGTGSGTDAEAGATASEGGAGSEAGLVEAGIEAGPSCPIALPSAADFYTTLAAERCTNIGSCCTLSYPSGTVFNNSACLSVYADAPGWLSAEIPSNFLGSGRITYNTANACSCLQQNVSLACGTLSGTSPDAGFVALEYVCNEALQGNSPPGGQCASSFECAPGEYCSVELAADPADSSQLGLCSSQLLAQGASCTADTQCSYLALGQPSLYCDTTTTNECQPRAAAGSPCSADDQCISGLCDGTSCLIGQAVASSFICSYLSTTADGGE
jgi:hypothetical protein